MEFDHNTKLLTQSLGTAASGKKAELRRLRQIAVHAEENLNQLNDIEGTQKGDGGCDVPTHGTAFDITLAKMTSGADQIARINESLQPSDLPNVLRLILGVLDDLRRNGGIVVSTDEEDGDEFDLISYDKLFPTARPKRTYIEEVFNFDKVDFDSMCLPIHAVANCKAQLTTLLESVKRFVHIHRQQMETSTSRHLERELKSVKEHLAHVVSSLVEANSKLRVMEKEGRKSHISTSRAAAAFGAVLHASSDAGSRQRGVMEDTKHRLREIRTEEESLGSRLKAGEGDRRGRRRRTPAGEDSDSDGSEVSLAAEEEQPVVVPVPAVVVAKPAAAAPVKLPPPAPRAATPTLPQISETIPEKETPVGLDPTPEAPPAAIRPTLNTAGTQVAMDTPVARPVAVQLHVASKTLMSPRACGGVEADTVPMPRPGSVPNMLHYLFEARPYQDASGGAQPASRGNASGGRASQAPPSPIASSDYFAVKDRWDTLKTARRTAQDGGDKSALLTAKPPQSALQGGASMETSESDVLLMLLREAGTQISRQEALLSSKPADVFSHLGIPAVGNGGDVPHQASESFVVSDGGPTTTVSSLSCEQQLHCVRRLPYGLKHGAPGARLSVLSYDQPSYYQWAAGRLKCLTALAKFVKERWASPPLGGKPYPAPTLFICLRVSDVFTRLFQQPGALEETLRGLETVVQDVFFTEYDGKGVAGAAAPTLSPNGKRPSSIYKTFSRDGPVWLLYSSRRDDVVKTLACVLRCLNVAHQGLPHATRLNVAIAPTPAEAVHLSKHVRAGEILVAGRATQVPMDVRSHYHVNDWKLNAADVTPDGPPEVNKRLFGEGGGAIPSDVTQAVSIVDKSLPEDRGKLEAQCAEHPAFIAHSLGKVADTAHRQIDAVFERLRADDIASNVSPPTANTAAQCVAAVDLLGSAACWLHAAKSATIAALLKGKSTPAPASPRAASPSAAEEGQEGGASPESPSAGEGNSAYLMFISCVERFRKDLRQRLTDTGGWEVWCGGDAFFCAFRTHRQALAFGSGCIVKYPWPIDMFGDTPQQTGIMRAGIAALSTGAEVSVTPDGSIPRRECVTAALLCGSSEGDQVMVSQAMEGFAKKNMYETGTASPQTVPGVCDFLASKLLQGDKKQQDAFRQRKEDFAMGPRVQAELLRIHKRIRIFSAMLQRLATAGEVPFTDDQFNYLWCRVINSRTPSECLDVDEIVSMNPKIKPLDFLRVKTCIDGAARFIIDDDVREQRVFADLQIPMVSKSIVGHLTRSLKAFHKIRKMDVGPSFTCGPPGKVTLKGLVGQLINKSGASEPVADLIRDASSGDLRLKRVVTALTGVGAAAESGARNPFSLKGDAKLRLPLGDAAAGSGGDGSPRSPRLGVGDASGEGRLPSPRRATAKNLAASALRGRFEASAKLASGEDGRDNMAAAMQVFDQIPNSRPKKLMGFAAQRQMQLEEKMKQLVQRRGTATSNSLPPAAASTGSPLSGNGSVRFAEDPTGMPSADSSVPHFGGFGSGGGGGGGNNVLSAETLLSRVAKSGSALRQATGRKEIQAVLFDMAGSDSRNVIPGVPQSRGNTGSSTSTLKFSTMSTLKIHAQKRAKGRTGQKLTLPPI